MQRKALFMAGSIQQFIDTGINELEKYCPAVRTDELPAEEIAIIRSHQ